MPSSSESRKYVLISKNSSLEVVRVNISRVDIDHNMGQT